jgi:hypothetical protein
MGVTYGAGDFLLYIMRFASGDWHDKCSTPCFYAYSVERTYDWNTIQVYTLFKCQESCS